MIWPWKLLIWKLGILPKHRLAFWLFAHGKFLTKDRQPYDICALCKCDNESFFQHCFSCVIRQMNYGGRRETGWGWRKQWSCYRGSSKVAKFRISVIAGPYTTYGTWGINSCLMGENTDLNAILRKIQNLIHRTHILDWCVAFSIDIAGDLGYALHICSWRSEACLVYLYTNGFANVFLCY